MTAATSSTSFLRSGGLFTLRGFAQVLGPFVVASVALLTLGTADLASFVLVSAIFSVGPLSSPAVSSVVYRFRGSGDAADATSTTIILAITVALGLAGGALAGTFVEGVVLVPLCAANCFLVSLGSALSAELGRVGRNAVVARLSATQAIGAVVLGTAALGLTRSVAGYVAAVGVSQAWLTFRLFRAIRTGQRPSFQLGWDRVQRALMLRHISVVLAWIPLVFLTSGADVFFVKVFDQTRVSGYGIAVRLVAIGAIPLTVAASLLPPSLLDLRSLVERRAHFARTTQVTGTVTSLAVALVIFVGAFAMPFLPLDRGEIPSRGVLACIGLAVALRGTWTPANLMMLQHGNHVRSLLPGSTETVCSIAVTVVAGRVWGAEGVAFGTLAGAVASFVFYTVVCARNSALGIVHLFDVLKILRPNLFVLASLAIAVSVPSMPSRLGGLALCIAGTYMVARKHFIERSAVVPMARVAARSKLNEQTAPR